MNEKTRKVRCFMDGIDWQHELGEASRGNTLYPSAKCLKKGAKHDLAECGIVEVEVRLVRWVKAQKRPRIRRAKATS